MRPRLANRSCAIVALVLCFGCITRSQQYAIEIKRGATVEEKLRLAKAVVTEQRLARLKEEVKQRLPHVTDEQLSGMGLRWNENHFRSVNTGETSTSVTVVVAIQERAGVDGAAVVKAAADVLDREINGEVPSTIERPR